MTTRKRTGCACAVLAFALAGSAEGELAPGVELATFSGEPDTELVAGDPLLLYVSIDAGAARAVARINAENEQMAETLLRSEDFQGLSEAEKQEILQAYAPQEIPAFRLGSSTNPLRGLISFRVTDERGDSVDMTLRPLAANDTVPAQVELTPDEPVILRYGGDPEALAATGAGSLSVVARLDTRNLAGMWQGETESSPITTRLVSRAPTPDSETEKMRLYMVGTYFLDDHQFDRAKSVAEELLATDPSFIGGWLHLGDALAGLGQQAEALKAFEKAMNLYYQKGAVEGEPFEHPEYTAQRIRDMEAQLASPN